MQSFTPYVCNYNGIRAATSLSFHPVYINLQGPLPYHNFLSSNMEKMDRDKFLMKNITVLRKPYTGCLVKVYHQDVSGGSTLTLVPAVWANMLPECYRPDVTADQCQFVSKGTNNGLLCPSTLPLIQNVATPPVLYVSTLKRHHHSCAYILPSIPFPVKYGGARWPPINWVP